MFPAVSAWRLVSSSERATASERRSAAAALPAHEAVGHVGRACRLASLTRRPVPTTARGFDEEDVAGPDRDTNLLGLQDAGRAAPGEQAVSMRLTVLAAEEAVGRVAHTVARGVGHAGLVDVDAQAQDRPHPTPVLAVAGRVGTELVVLERERKARFRDLDAAELDAAGRLALARRLPAVTDRGRSPTRPGMEHVPDERALGARVLTLDRDAEAPAPARERAVGTRRRERLDDRFHDLLRAVVGREGHRCRRVRMHDGARPGEPVHHAEGT